MALSNSSKSIRVYFDDDEAEIRIRFKQLAARAEAPMSRRAADLIKLDIAYWEVTGEILDLSQLDKIVRKLSHQKNGHEETNGHHAPRQVKVVKPRKHHKTYRDKVGELVGELAGNQVKVSFDGEEKAFDSDEIELVETE